jgi:hypothetical protein
MRRKSKSCLSGIRVPSLKPNAAQIDPCGSGATANQGFATGGRSKVFFINAQHVRAPGSSSVGGVHAAATLPNLEATSEQFQKTLKAFGQT